MEAGDVEAQEGCCRLRAAGGHDDRGRNSRTQTLLSICQRQRESSTSARERCSTRRFSVYRTWRRRPAFRNPSLTLSNVFRVANERYFFAKERYMSLYLTFIHQCIKPRSRHSTEKKKNTTIGRSCISHHLDVESPRRIETV